MPPTGRVHDEQVLKLHAEGISPVEIARKLSLTRQRVGQILNRNGIKGRNYTWMPTKEEAVAGLRDSGSFEEALSALELDEKRFEKTVSELDLGAEVANARKHWKANARASILPKLRAEQLARIETAAAAVGHTPDMKELETFGVNHPNLKRLFGSAAEAMKAVGLEPNLPGKPPRPLPPGWQPGTVSTDDIAELMAKARSLLKRPALPPLGPNPQGPPQQTTRKSRAFIRDPKVVAHALMRAGGTCELCKQQGYEVDDGSRFLEVHHVRPLEDGGPDSLDNAAGVCETCHGRLHRDKDRVKLRGTLIASVAGLVDYPLQSVAAAP